MSESSIRWLPLAVGMAILGIGLGVGLTLAVQSLWPQSTAEDAAGGGGGWGMPVEVENATAIDMPLDYRTLGALRSPQRAVLRAVETGRVTAIGFEDGQPVSRGDMLIELDSGHEIAAVAAAKAELVEAQRVVSQAQRLVSNNVLPEDELDRRQAQVDLAKARLAEAQAVLDDRTILAPFSGTVTRRTISLGDTVGTDDPIVELIATETLRISTAIPERYLAVLHDEIPIRITSPAAPGKVYQAKVSYIAPEIDASTRSIVVEAEINNSEGLLRHGQSVDITATVRTVPNTLSVPEESVLHQGNRISVFVVADGAAQPRAVTLGPRSNGRVVILEGLTAGDQVVVEGHEMLRPGAPVSIVNLTTEDQPR